MEGDPPEGGDLIGDRPTRQLVLERHHAAGEPQDAALEGLVDRGDNAAV